MKILICGLPGSGKTTLAKVLAPLLGAVHFNGDKVRETISRDLDFSAGARLVQAERMAAMCDTVVEAGHYAIADFICPTTHTREVFNAKFTIWMDTVQASRYEDTNAMFEPPENDLRIVSLDYDPLFIADVIRAQFNPFQGRYPTALFLGRYQPFHLGHRALILEGLQRVGQVCIAVRDTYGDSSNPFEFQEVKSHIIVGLGEHYDPAKITIIKLPNITNIFYGRDVGYSIEKIDLDKQLEDISATQIRKDMGL